MFETKKTKKKRSEIKREKQEIKLRELNKFRFVPLKKKSYKWLIFPAVFLVLIVLVVLMVGVSNAKIDVDKVSISHKQLPESFDGYTILQISDIHGHTFGESNSKLINTINELDFDMILFTGDMLGHPDDEDDIWKTVDLIEAIARENVPIYYVLGESDYEPENKDNLEDDWNMCIEPKEKTPFMVAIEEVGAQPVYPIQEIRRGNDVIFLTGVKYYEDLFDEYGFDTDMHFTICVTHKPITYNVNRRLETINKNSYNEVDYDLSISGHTHGGTVRLPILGALYVEGHGVLPSEKYAQGLHYTQGRYNYISQGLGTGDGFPVRVCCTPTVSLLTLNCP